MPESILLSDHDRAFLSSLDALSVEAQARFAQSMQDITRFRDLFLRYVAASNGHTSGSLSLSPDGKELVPNPEPKPQS